MDVETLRQVLREVHQPPYGALVDASDDALKCVGEMVDSVAEAVVRYASRDPIPKTPKDSNAPKEMSQEVLTPHAVLRGVFAVVFGELSKYAISEATRAVHDNKKLIVTDTAAQAIAERVGVRLDTQAARYLAAVMEYLAEEVLELAEREGRKIGKITYDTVTQAVQSDDELKRLFQHAPQRKSQRQRLKAVSLVQQLLAHAQGPERAAVIKEWEADHETRIERQLKQKQRDDIRCVSRTLELMRKRVGEGSPDTRVTGLEELLSGLRERGEVLAQSLIPSSSSLRSAGFPIRVKTVGPRNTTLTITLTYHRPGAEETTVEFFANRDALNARVQQLCGYAIGDKIAWQQLAGNRSVTRSCPRWYVHKLRFPVQSIGPATFTRV